MKARHSATTLVAVLAVALVGACGGGNTEALPADRVEGLDEAQPTAPSGSFPGDTDLGEGDPSSDTVDVNGLIRRIDALSQETELCALVGSEAVVEIIGADINLTGLASNPSGVGQLFAALERLYAHMATIGPPEVTPALTTLQGVSSGLADIDLRSPDAEARAEELLESPDTRFANEALGAWISLNCTTG